MRHKKPARKPFTLPLSNVSDTVVRLTGSAGKDHPAFSPYAGQKLARRDSHAMNTKELDASHWREFDNVNEMLAAGGVHHMDTSYVNEHIDIPNVDRRMKYEDFESETAVNDLSDCPGDDHDIDEDTDDFKYESDDEEDEDYKPDRYNDTPRSLKGRKQVKGSALARSRRGNSSTLSAGKTTPRISTTFYNPTLTFTGRSSISERKDTVREYKLSSAELLDVKEGGVQLRREFIAAFDSVFDAHRDRIARLAMDELGRVIVWLASIRTPPEGAKVKYDWEQAFRKHLHGVPGDLVLLKMYCLEKFETVSWDRDWDKSSLHDVDSKKRTELICGLMSMYIQEWDADEDGRKLRIRSLPKTDWDMTCHRQGRDLPMVYSKIKNVMRHLNNLAKVDNKAKPKKPKSKAFVDTDEEGEDESTLGSVAFDTPAATARARSLQNGRFLTSHLEDHEATEEEIF